MKTLGVLALVFVLMVGSVAPVLAISPGPPDSPPELSLELIAALEQVELAAGVIATTEYPNPGPPPIGAAAGPGFFSPTGSNGPGEAPPKVFDCTIIARSNVENFYAVNVELYGGERCDKSRVAVARETLRQVRCAMDNYCPPPPLSRWPLDIKPKP